MGRTGETVGAVLLVAGLAAGCTEVVTPPAPTFAAKGCEHFAPRFAQGVDPIKAIAQAIQDCYNNGPVTVDKKINRDDNPPLPAENNVITRVHEKDGGTVTFVATSPEPVTSQTFADKAVGVEFSIQRGLKANGIFEFAMYGKAISGPIIDWAREHPSPGGRLQVVKGVKDYAMYVPFDQEGPKGTITYDPSIIACAKQQAYGAFAQLMATAPDFTPGTPDLPVPVLRPNCDSTRS